MNRGLFGIQNRLRQLSANCGGRVLSVQGDMAVLGFANHDLAVRSALFYLFFFYAIKYNVML